MRVLIADEVAQLLRVPVPRVYELARQGQIPHMRLGRQVRFRQEAVEHLWPPPAPPVGGGNGSPGAVSIPSR